VQYLIDTHHLSVRRACASLGFSRSAWYQPVVDWLERDRPIAEALLALSESKNDAALTCRGGAKRITGQVQRLVRHVRL